MNAFDGQNQFASAPMSAVGNDIDMADIQVAAKISVNERENAENNPYAIENHHVFHPMNAWELFEQEKGRAYISTSCPKMDDMLGGGVETGKITEFCGDSNAGKAQIR